jgi:excisionase family DNA binding protein
MTPIADLDQAVTDTPLAQLPELICVLARLTARAQMRLTGPAPVRQETETLLTVREVAQQLKMSSYRVYELCRHGLMQSRKYGKSVRIKPSAVADYLAKQGA